MTETRLLQLVRTSPLIRDAGLSIDNDSIDNAASLAQSEILSDCEPIEVLKSFDFVANQELYTLSGLLLPWIPEMGRVIDPIYYADSAKGIIKKSTREWVDEDRQRIKDGGSQPSPPLYFYVLLTEPKTIGFWGIPTEVLTVNVRYKRAHASTDNITGRGTAVHPLIPDTYEKCLKLGTIYNIFEDRMDKFPALAKASKELFQQEKNRMTAKRTLSNSAAVASHNELKW